MEGTTFLIVADDGSILLESGDREIAERYFQQAALAAEAAPLLVAIPDSFERE